MTSSIYSKISWTKYCMQFDDVDENKLEYTDIHKEYVSIFKLW